MIGTVFERASDLLGESLKQRFGPIISRLLLPMPIICVVSVILSYGAWLEAASVREISTYDHVTASVEQTHMVHPSRGATYQMSDIAFNTQKNGLAIRCESEQPTNGLKPGDTIDIIVQPETCHVPIIVSGTPSYFIGFMIAFGIIATTSFLLSIPVAHYASRLILVLWRKRHRIEWS